MTKPIEKPVLVEVAVGLPIEGAFTYIVPENMGARSAEGTRVLVPFGKRKVTGYVLGPGKPVEDAEIKEIIEILDDVPSIPPTLLNDLKWMAEYYLAPIGETIKGALPAGIEVAGSAGLVISEGGEKALALDSTAKAERELLARIASEPGIARKRLEALMKEKGVRSRISSLVRKGWVFQQEKIRAPSVKPREAKLVRIVESDPERIQTEIEKMKKAAPARSRILTYVASAKSALLTELSARFKNAAFHARKLEEEGLVEFSSVRVWRDPAVGEALEADSIPPELTSHQARSLDEINHALNERRFAPFLLHGVTGSGKTEVYLRAIDRVIELGRKALVLVPEIALTPQLVGRFRARFGQDVAVLHSALGRGERLDEWTRVRRAMVKVAIGARSAVFAPFENIGLIVVDEEHDGGYKQEEKVRYNARDFAVVRARSNNAVVILGSATPSLESRRNAITGRYKLLELPCRVHERRMPSVEIVDMRAAAPGRTPFLSLSLEKAIEENLAAGKQTLLFLNRRGFAPFLMCVKCGYTFGCQNCTASLTYHRRNRMMRCHLCDFSEPAPDICPKCRGANLKMFGVGTERVEDEISRLFPEARVARMDRDAVTRKGEIEKVLASIKDGTTDILVGTQMIAKGHDYPGVTLVGVILAETSLNFPDFRAAETTFSLLAQVAGRAGRGADPGRVVVQTFNPDHYAIRNAIAHDYDGFASEEDKLRRKVGYPPYRRLAAIRFSGKDALKVRDAAKAAAQLAKRVKGVEILGPAPAPWSKVKNEFRWQLLIKSEKSNSARKAAQYAYKGTDGKFTGVKVTVDVDPLRLL